VEEQSQQRHFRQLARGSRRKGNEGVTGLVKQTPNSIGYVELIYAAKNNVSYAQ